MSKTNWDKIVSGNELLKAKRNRNKTYIVKKERSIALPDLIDEGWEKYKDYKNTKFVAVKKEKSLDEQFEDKIWMLFANMGFSEMNCDRKFEMSYDFQNPNNTQQIDVFAADEETILIIECKAAEKLKEGNFKKLIEALHGQMDGLRKEAIKEYPGRKVKFIWATHNYIMNNADLAKLKDWGIAYFNESAINYYIELVKHLGTSAKYQLLGNLFANTEINNMEEKIPAIQGKMGGHIYYSFSIEPERLLKIGYILHRNDINKDLMPTYQRLIKKRRLKEVKEFIERGGYFPNSIIININTSGRGVQFDQSSSKVEGSISKLGILHLPKKYRSAYIIDGQHRLYGYLDSEYALKNTIPVVAFVDLDLQEQIKLFMDINENQKAVSKTLRVTLNADLLWGSSDFNEQRQALRSKIAQMLGEEATSPLFSRIVIGENESSPTKCITVEAIQTALKSCDFFTKFNDKKNTIKKDGTFDLGSNEATCDLFYQFIEECLKYIKKNAEVEWEKGEADNGILTINRGIQAIIRVINSIVNHLVSSSTIQPKIDRVEDTVKSVCYYLEPLIKYINDITIEQKKELRSFFGGGADTRFFRTFQKIISESIDDFKPEGLEDYWRNETKIFNADSLDKIHHIEVAVKKIISEKLEDHYGEAWLIKGLPKNVYTSAKSRADKINYDNIVQGNLKEELSAWDVVSLSECKSIILNGNNWSGIFESFMVRPEDVKAAGGREVKTKWLNKLQTIATNLDKKAKTYSVSKDDYEFIKAVYFWICTENQ